MTSVPTRSSPPDALAGGGNGGAAPTALARLVRERDQLLEIHEAVVEAERAPSTEERLGILTRAVRRLGYGRVEAIENYVLPSAASVALSIGNSVFLRSNELVVPLRSAGGATIATLVLGEPEDLAPPTLVRVRTVELFAQQVATIIENARRYDESQRERRRGEVEAKAAAERYRQAIGDERRARDAVAQSEARYRNLFETASDAIYTLDSQGSFTSVNEATCQMSGRARDELLGRSPLALVAAGEVAMVKEHFKAAVAGSVRRYECQFVRPDGTRRTASVTNAPIRHGSQVIGILGVARDVTDEKRLMEQLMQQEKLAAVGQLVSGVAHELNNPLASVMAFAQLLLAAPPGAAHDRRAIEAINQESKRAAKIVSNLLTFARQHQPERTVADLNRVIEDTLELRRYALRTARVEAVTELDPHLPATWADPFQLQQVILNLITNAEQALSTWNGERRITVGTDRDGELLVIRVADTGPGIAAEHLSRIFNPFFTTKPVGEGTGLGLSISDGIVREHGGRILAESRNGKPGSSGALFVIELPYVEPPAPEIPPAAGPTSPESAAKRLLVVDDEQAIRSAIATFFRSLGHMVDTVATGREALARATAARYDALLLDLRLPDTTGDQVLHELDLLARTPARVVFVTGDTQSESARQALEATGRPVVSKPFLLDELACIVLAEAAD